MTPYTPTANWTGTIMLPDDFVDLRNAISFNTPYRQLANGILWAAQRAIAPDADVTIDGSLTVNYDLDVHGAANVSGNLDVGGLLSPYAVAVGVGGMNVSGPILCSGVSASSTITCPAIETADIQVISIANPSGAVEIPELDVGLLNVTGTATLADVTVSQPINCTGSGGLVLTRTGGLTVLGAEAGVLGRIGGVGDFSGDLSDPYAVPRNSAGSKIEIATLAVNNLSIKQYDIVEIDLSLMWDNYDANAAAWALPSVEFSGTGISGWDWIEGFRLPQLVNNHVRTNHKILRRYVLSSPTTVSWKVYGVCGADSSNTGLNVYACGQSTYRIHRGLESIGTGSG